MNLRAEPRFKTDTSVTLQSRSRAQPVPARVVDVSGAGFRLSVEEPIAVGEVLQINVEDRHLLVMVRHCGPVDNRYFVGVERIDKWLPGDPANASLAALPENAAVLGRPQLKGDRDPLRIMALRNQFSNHSFGKDQRGLMLGGIATVIGLGVLALIWGGVRGFGHTDSTPRVPAKQAEDTARGTTNTSKPQPLAHAGSIAAVPASSSQAATKSPAALPIRPARSGPLQVTLHASELSWVDACADGKLIFSKAFGAGETGQMKFSKVATIRAGNAGGLKVSFGSNPAERMGEKGLIHMWKFTPRGRQEVPPNSKSACTIH